MSMNADAILKLRKSPEQYIEKVLGCNTLEPYHRDICKAVVEHDKVLIRATHSVGKTWLLGRLALWFSTTFSNSKVITSAPTFRQVKDLLWVEIKRAHKDSKIRLGGKMLDTRYEPTSDNPDWFMLGFSPKKESESDSGDGGQKGSSFQGYHAKYIFIIFDEATGVPAQVYTQAEGLTTSGVIVKWVCIANPTSRNSEFYRLHKAPDWHKIKLTCFDSPNMIANGFTNLGKVKVELKILAKLTDKERIKRIKEYKKPNGHLLTAQWAVSKLYAWGITHPLSLSKILGEFPNEDDSSIVAFQSVLNARGRDRTTPEKMTKRYIGIDVARYGDDKTIIQSMHDNIVMVPTELTTADNVEVADRALLEINRYQGIDTMVQVDATGVGSGVIDILRQYKRAGKMSSYIILNEVHNGMSPYDSEYTKGTDDEDKNKKLFANLKAQMFFYLNEQLRDFISLPDIDDYEDELPTIKFKFNRQGKIVIESKEEYKSRTGLPSPDLSDALSLAVFGKVIAPNSGKFSDIKNQSKSITKRTTRPTKSRIKIKEY